MALTGAGRALFLSESSRNVGGQELQLLMQAGLLRQAGWQPRVLCRPGSRIAALAAERGLPWEPVPMRNALDVASIARVVRLVHRHQPAAIVCHSGHDTNVCAVAARLATLGGAPRPRLLRMRTYLAGRPGAFGANHLVDHTYTPSAALRDELLAGSGIRPQRVGVLYPAIDFAALRSAATQALPPAVQTRLAQPGTGPVLVHAAMLRGEKGHAFVLDLLPRLLERYPGLLYVAAGEGPLQADLQARAHALGVQGHVLFAGMLSPVAPLLARADVVLMPSLREPLGMSQVEALALGTPVVVSRVGGLPETVEDGVTGWVCPPPGTPDAAPAWADAIDQVLRDPLGAADRARLGGERMRRQFDPAANLATLLAACGGD